MKNVSASLRGGITKSLVLAFVVGSALVACKKDAPPEPPAAELAEVFQTRGRVVAVSDKALTIQHEKIARIRSFDGDYVEMESMAMQFGKANVEAAKAIVKDDLVAISFTVHYKSDPTLRLKTVEKLPADTTLALPAH